MLAMISVAPISRAGPPSCTYDPVSETVVVVLPPEITTDVIKRDGSEIVFGNSTSGFEQCGSATVDNTDRVEFRNGATEEVVIDLSGGHFIPGSTPETEGVSEIEFFVGKGEELGMIIFRGTDDSDSIDCSSSGVRLNEDADADFRSLDAVTRIYVLGEAGNDVVDLTNCSEAPPSKPHLVSGGLGRDRLIGGPGFERMDGDEGSDVLRGGLGGAKMFGDYGDDLLVAAAGTNTLDGGPGSDTVLGGPGDDKAVGGDHPDLVKGGEGNDLIKGHFGHDSLWGQRGDDDISGGRHNDHIIAGDGRDFVYGSGGDDHLEGSAGNDKIFGYSGADLLDGDAGVDKCSGGTGPDTKEDCES